MDMVTAILLSLPFVVTLQRARGVDNNNVNNVPINDIPENNLSPVISSINGDNIKERFYNEPGNTDFVLQNIVMGFQNKHMNEQLNNVTNTTNTGSGEEGSNQMSNDSSNLSNIVIFEKNMIKCDKIYNLLKHDLEELHLKNQEDVLDNYFNNLVNYINTNFTNGNTGQNLVNAILKFYNNNQTNIGCDKEYNELYFNLERIIEKIYSKNNSQTFTNNNLDESELDTFVTNSPALTNDILNENVNSPLTNGNEITGGPSLSNLNVPQGLDNEEALRCF